MPDLGYDPQSDERISKERARRNRLMTPTQNFVMALARKWCYTHGDQITEDFCICPKLTAAISEALEKAKTIAMLNDDCQDCTTAERIATAIAALLNP